MGDDDDDDDDKGQGIRKTRSFTSEHPEIDLGSHCRKSFSSCPLVQPLPVQHFWCSWSKYDFV